MSREMCERLTAGKHTPERLQERKLLEHHETELCSPSHRFGPTVRIELGENGSDVKLSGVEGDSQPTCDGFVGEAICHRSKYFELAGGYNQCEEINFQPT